MEWKKEEIDQVLYSRIRMRSSDEENVFFMNSIGQPTFDKVRLTYTDTNLYRPYQLNSKQRFMIRWIDIHMIHYDESVRKHLLQNAHIIVRIVDKDYLIIPIHLMERAKTFFRKRFKVPIQINEWESFRVIIRMDTAFSKEFDLTCELNGGLTRPI